MGTRRDFCSRGGGCCSRGGGRCSRGGGCCSHGRGRCSRGGGCCSRGGSCCSRGGSGRGKCFFRLRAREGDGQPRDLFLDGSLRGERGGGQGANSRRDHGDEGS